MSLDVARLRALEEAATCPVPSCPGYAADDEGRIWSIATNWRGYGPRVLSTHLDKSGYLRVAITLDGRKTPRTVHRLVAEAFHGPRPDGLQVRHLDGDKHNNRPANLAYGTAADNASDRENHGRTARGERNGFAKLSLEDVQYIRELASYGMKPIEIEKHVSVTRSQVARVLRGERWARALLSEPQQETP